MPTELEELVEFLHHGNTEIRQIACHNLVGYSEQPSIFKTAQLEPIKDLKLLIRDYPPIAKDAITILINLSSHDEEIRANLAEDDKFIIDLVRKITKPKDPTISELSSLLANLSAHPSLSRLLTLQIPPSPNKSIAINDTNASQPQSDIALDLLLDLFVTHPSDSPYDHLSYLLASLSGTSSAIRSYFLSPQSYDNVTPLSKIFVFTDHPSVIRRRGVASVLKNVCFEISSHPALLCLPSAAASEIDVLPYLLLPLISGSDSYDDDETDNMLPETQLLPPSKQREQDKEILTMLIESLTLLTTTREGRERLRDVQTYAIVRECHKKIEDEQFGEAVDRLVNVLMRGEEGEDETGGWVGGNDDEDGGRVIEEVL